MNRINPNGENKLFDVPRTRGDEPLKNKNTLKLDPALNTYA